MRSFLKLFIFAGLVSALMTGCYPNEDLSYSDLDLAGTNYDPTFAFEANMVCVLVNDVKWAVEDSLGRDEEIPNEAYIIAEVERNLKTTKFDVYTVNDTAELIALGVNPSDVDLLVTISVMENEITYYYPYYGYWYGGYYGWYWKSGSLKTAEKTDYYPYYPYYPYYGGTTVSYTAGTVFIDMADVNKFKPIGDTFVNPAVWNAVINGIESGSMSDHKTRITREVNQCFIQSPYLKN